MTPVTLTKVKVEGQGFRREVDGLETNRKDNLEIEVNDIKVTACKVYQDKGWT